MRFIISIIQIQPSQNLYDLSLHPTAIAQSLAAQLVKVLLTKQEVKRIAFSEWIAEFVQVSLAQILGFDFKSLT